MGYQFRGFFTDGPPEVGEAAVARWPGCRWRPVSHPFVGVGVRCPDADREAGDDETRYEELHELGYRVEDEVPEFSTRFPGLTFVFVHADCFGGVCVYSGYAARDGAPLLRISAVERGTRSLQQLLEPLGVRLKTGYFAPFVRGFWGER